MEYQGQGNEGRLEFFAASYTYHKLETAIDIRLWFCNYFSMQVLEKDIRFFEEQIENISKRDLEIEYKIIELYMSFKKDLTVISFGITGAAIALNSVGSDRTGLQSKTLFVGVVSMAALSIYMLMHVKNLIDSNSKATVQATEVKYYMHVIRWCKICIEKGGDEQALGQKALKASISLEETLTNNRQKIHLEARKSDRALNFGTIAFVAASGIIGLSLISDFEVYKRLVVLLLLGLVVLSVILFRDSSDVVEAQKAKNEWEEKIRNSYDEVESIAWRRS